MDDIKTIDYLGKTIQLVNYGRDKYSPIYKDKNLVWIVQNFTCKQNKEDFITAIKQMLDSLPETNPKNKLLNTKSEICLLFIDGNFTYSNTDSEMTAFCCIKSDDVKRI